MMRTPFWSDYQTDTETTWHDIKGDELVHGWQYWRFDDTFIPDDLDAINTYLESEFQDAGDNDSYLEAVDELFEVDGVWQFVTYDGNKFKTVPANWFRTETAFIKQEFHDDHDKLESMIAQASRIDVMYQL